MNRGLRTLMTVAIALVSVQAMAIAPTILDIPSPIVGNQTGGASQATKYVYPDAFDLTTLAVDNNTPPTSSTLLKWTYEIVGTPKYAINGLPVVNSSVDDVINPPDTKNINKTVDKTKETLEDGNTAAKHGDGLPNTVTIRNINLAPFSGTGATAAAGFVDTQAVTFWCSNGAAVSSSTVLFYTDNYTNGWNRLSSVGPWKFQNGESFINKSWPVQGGVIGTVTTTTWTDGKGICFTVPKPGDNMWSMASPYAFFTLSNNSVYRIRATMNCTQATPGKTPFWDFIVENWNDAIGKGLNLYGMDTFFLDNEGGANTVISTAAGTEFTMIWAPIAFRTPQWQSTTGGLYDPKFSADKDPYLRFRVMDAVANPGLMSDQKFGSICLQKVVVEAAPYAKFVDDPTPLAFISSSATPANPPKAATNTAPGGNIYAKALVGTNLNYTGGMLQIQPTGANGAWNAELVTLYPANNLDALEGSNIVPPYTQIADDWPIPWQSNKILKLEVAMSANDTAVNGNGDLHPFDVIWMSMEPPTNEVDAESYVTSNQRIGSPRYVDGTKITGPQTYTFFYYTMNETKSAVTQLHYLRWRVRFGNNKNLNFPLTSDLDNKGGVRVHSIKVSKVTVVP